MKLLICQFFPPDRNGLSKLASDLFHRFKYDKVITMNRGRKDKKIVEITLWDNIKVQRKEYDHSFLDNRIFQDPRISDICFAMGVNNFIKNNKTDVAHIVSASNDYILLYPFLDEKHIEVYLTIGGGGVRTKRSLEKLRCSVLNRADKISTTCKYLSFYLLSHDFTHIPNYVDLSKFYKKEIKKQEFIVSHIGRIAKVKGVYDVIKLSNIRPELRFNLIGQVGPDVNKNDILMKNNVNLIENIGFHDDKNLRKLYNSSDIFICPTYGDSMKEFGPETCPFSILEAMACEVPVLTTNVNGIPEIIRNGVNGFMTNPGNIKNMSIIIDKLKNNRKVREEIIQNAIETVREKFDKRKIFKKYENFLRF